MTGMLPSLDPLLHAKLEKLVDAFLEENVKINLAAFRTKELCWVGNVLDSLAMMEVLPSLLNKGHIANQKPETRKPINILDVGTGGGFPLLPLAVALPEVHFTGLDATRKKIAAVERIAEKLDVRNVTFICGRAEELGHDPEHREHYDLVLSRAVAEINTLLEYCSPFAKPSGHIALWKSLNIDQELQDSLLARAELSAHLIDQYRYELPANFGKRQLLVFEKSAALPRKYPRAIGIPKKHPLK